MGVNIEKVGTGLQCSASRNSIDRNIHEPKQISIAFKVTALNMAQYESYCMTVQIDRLASEVLWREAPVMQQEAEPLFLLLQVPPQTTWYP